MAADHRIGESVTLIVHGVRPAAQGSKIAWVPQVPGPGPGGKVNHPTMRPIMREQMGDEIKAFRGAIVAEARKVMFRREPMLGPVRVEWRAWFPRPKGHYGTGRNAETLKPQAPGLPHDNRRGDADKIERAILDALTIGGVYHDDGR